ncbi:unnamed protein product [Clonostachys rhizophaga]|uniref:TLDc domain-containing protein n=1 Tax=Clonostachys rhizophaga TaxID=160324 RepID=A0A9N9V9P4_9HYPO|nr:unnamed protein product [Clonostachys rhizophaga]
MDRMQTEGLPLPSDILDSLATERSVGPAPEKLPSGINVLDAVGLVSQLHARGDLPRPLANFAYFVYDMLAYLSTAPFYRRPGDQAPPRLSLPQLYRGIFWILPDAQCDLFGGSPGSRRRTAADHRRLLFQSLARMAYMPEQDDSAEAQKRAARNSYSGILPADVSADRLSVNYDEDGDEIYHDVLDALHAAQPLRGQADLGRPRDSFREEAQALTRGLPRLCTLAIPVDYFTKFIILLLALQFRDSREGHMLSQYEEAAESIVYSFCKGRETDIIRWPEFDDALKNMPFLFHPLYRLLSTAFRETVEYTGRTQWAAPKLPPDSFITLSRLSQLATMVNEDLDFENFERVHQWNGPPLATAKDLLATIEGMPSVSILAMCGMSPKGELVIFGIFVPMFMGASHTKTGNENRERNSVGPAGVPTSVEMDGAHDWVSGSSVARSFMFVLRPEQRIIRFKGNPCIIGSHLYFGDALIMSNNGTVVIKYGTGSMRINVEAIEIWGETTLNPTARFN